MHWEEAACGASGAGPGICLRYQRHGLPVHGCCAVLSYPSAHSRHYQPNLRQHAPPPLPGTRSWAKAIAIATQRSTSHLFVSPPCSSLSVPVSISLSTLLSPSLPLFSSSPSSISLILSTLRVSPFSASPHLSFLLSSSLTLCFCLYLPFMHVLSCQGTLALVQAGWKRNTNQNY